MFLKMEPLISFQDAFKTFDYFKNKQQKCMK